MLSCGDFFVIQASERQLRDENLNLRKESRHKDGLLDNLTKRDRGVGVQKDAVRLLCVFSSVDFSVEIGLLAFFC